MNNEIPEWAEPWFYMDPWTEQEFVDLLCGENPDSDCPRTDEINNEINKASRQVRRAMDAGELPYRITTDRDYDPWERAEHGDRRSVRPADAIKWATKVPARFPKFPFPEAEGCSVETTNGNDEPATSDEKSLSTPPAELGARERETVTKLIAGFLLARCKPEEWAHPYKLAGEIQAALDNVGSKLDDDTIAKWVKQAANRLPIPETPKASTDARAGARPKN